MQFLLSTLLVLWTSSNWVYSQGTVRRIHTYPYPDPPGYGMKIIPEEETLTGNRLKRNDATEDLQPRIESEDSQSSSPDDDSFSSSSQGVNRMGLPARVTRRKIPSIPEGPRRRTSLLTGSGSATQRSTTLRSFGNIPGALPPAIPNVGNRPPSIPSPGPPAPPVRPPGTPVTTIPAVGPPSPPEAINSPAPPPGADNVQVTEIKCIETSTKSSFMALLSLPAGYNAIPVFEDSPSVDPTINTECRMIPTQLTNDMFQLIVSDLEKCGVRRCQQSNGETWLCLNLRFPLVNGLKLPEDKTVLIRCRPQDKTQSDTPFLTVATAKYAAKGVPITDLAAQSVFDGREQDFRCEIGLFRKLPGTDIFASMVTNEELDLGEEVQLRSIIGSGDGWVYSLLTTVIIQKAGNTRSAAARSILNAADLVFADGCRNPSYKVIAANHPKRDSRNPLINNFTFRIFMFQDMAIDDKLMITANVIGCVEAEDCVPTQCEGPDEIDRLGYGKRKKRGVKHYSVTTIIPASDFIKATPTPPYPPPSNKLHQPTSHAHYGHENITTNWQRNINVRVKIPNNEIYHQPIEAHECQLYLFITLGVAALFCVASIVFVIVTLFRSRSPKQRRTSIQACHMGTRSNPPGTLTSNASSLKSSTCASSVLTSKESVSTDSSSNSPLRNFMVPATVRQRKREVNAELLNVFDGEQLFPYGTHCPGMLNYYGYMVVPRKSSAEASNEKRSLRAIKRDLKKYRSDRLEQMQQNNCRCSDSTLQSSSEEENTSKDQNHKSVIHVSASSSTTPSRSSHQCPKPLPRLKKEENDENVYSEIYLENNPTMV